MVMPKFKGEDGRHNSSYVPGWRGELKMKFMIIFLEGIALQNVAVTRQIDFYEK